MKAIFRQVISYAHTCMERKMVISAVTRNRRNPGGPDKKQEAADANQLSTKREETTMGSWNHSKDRDGEIYKDDSRDTRSSWGRDDESDRSRGSAADTVRETRNDRY